MNEALQEYIHRVLTHVPHASPHRQRIAEDLRVHLDEASRAGEPPTTLLERMGEPEEVARGYLAEEEPRYASHPRRSLAFLLDMGLGILVLLCVALLWGVETTLLDHVGSEGGLTDASRVGAMLGLVAAGLTAFVLAVAYFPLLEGRYGQTLGKWLTGLHVVRVDGLRIGYKEALIRRIPFFLEFFWIDALVALFTERRQRAFDLVASTVVVEVMPASAATAAERPALDNG